MASTSIGWVDKNLNWLTWNCNKVSEGCRNCYAEAMAKRNNKIFNGAPSWREGAIKDYNALVAGDAVFVNTMSDSFHEGVSLEWIQRMFTYARQKPLVTFCFLTKRIDRALQLAPMLGWADNIWIGTSVENRKRLNRLDALRKMPTENRFVSVEPLLESLGTVNLSGIKGIIVGGESGPDRRVFNKMWAKELLTQCQRQQVKFFFKQGSEFKPGQDRDIDGDYYDDLPWETQKAQPADTQAGMF